VSAVSERVVLQEAIVAAWAKEGHYMSIMFTVAGIAADVALATRDARIARLEAALRFYADAANYGQSHGADCGQVYTGDGNVEEYHGGDCGLPEVIRDDGAKARAALAKDAAKS